MATVREGASPPKYARRVLSVLYRHRAWFRHGLAAQEIGRRGKIRLAYAIAGCHAGIASGHLVIIGQKPGEGPVYALTPLGVASAIKYTTVRHPRPAPEAW